MFCGSRERRGSCYKAMGPSEQASNLMPILSSGPAQTPGCSRHSGCLRHLGLVGTFATVFSCQAVLLSFSACLVFPMARNMQPCEFKVSKPEVMFSSQCWVNNMKMSRYAAQRRFGDIVLAFLRHFLVPCNYCIVHNCSPMQSLLPCCRSTPNAFKVLLTTDIKRDYFEKQLDTAIFQLHMLMVISWSCSSSYWGTICIHKYS